MRSGRLYPPLTQGVATAGSESSSSPGPLLFKTPTSQLGINGGSQHPSKRKAGGHGPTLADEVEHLLPTPQAHDRTGPKTLEQIEAQRRRGQPGVRNLNETAVHELAPLLPTPAARDSKSGESNLLERNARPLNEVAVAHLRPSARDLLPTPTASLGTVEATAPWKDGVIWWKQSRASRNVAAIAESMFAQDVVDYGRYARAVLRWAQVINRLPPSPLEMSPRGTLVLSPPFVEWMMGLEPGWVTGLGLSRGAQLKLLGNGVVPQQVVLGLSILLPRVPVLWKQ
jgi:DNA (cytosine-5)-methyltransferase 1